jgi:hypothetical protein
MSRHVRELYDPAIRPARERFAASPALSAFPAGFAEPALLELFLIQFCSLGVGLTEPVEGWLTRAGARCEEVGLPELGRALRRHSRQEAGHHLMMIADTHALVGRWNARRTPPLDAERLLRRDPTPGGRLYRQLHEDTIAGPTPFAQIAIEYEIEMLPLQFGPQFLQQCAGVLGPDALDGLSFLREHITLDVAHTRFNEQQLGRLLEKHPDYLPALVRAGAAALHAYATFLGDCVGLAHAQFTALAGTLLSA